MTTVSLLTSQGVSALKAGDREQAQKWLRLAVKRNPNDITAWLWLSGAVDSDQERLECLQQVLRVAPGHAAATAGIEKLQKARASQAKPTPVDYQTKVAPFSEPYIVEEKSEKPTPLFSTPLEPNRVPISEQVVFDIRPSLVPVFLSAFLIFVLLGAASWLMLNFFDGTNIYLIILAVVFGFILVANLVVIVRAVLRFFFSKYRLTTRSLTVQTGVLSRNKTTILAKNIRQVEQKQTFLARIFKLGDIFVEGPSEQNQVRLRSIVSSGKRVSQILKVIEMNR